MMRPHHQRQEQQRDWIFSDGAEDQRGDQAVGDAADGAAHGNPEVERREVVRGRSVVGQVAVAEQRAGEQRRQKDDQCEPQWQHRGYDDQHQTERDAEQRGV